MAADLVERIEKDLKNSGIYFQLKKLAEDEMVKSSYSFDVEKDLHDFIKQSGFDIMLENEIYKYETNPKNKPKNEIEENRRKDPLDYIRKAQVSWEKCIVKSINSMCTELALPLARKRAVKDQEYFASEFDALAIGSHYDDEGSKNLRPVYSSADFFEALIALRNPNYELLNKTSADDGWCVIKIPIKTKEIGEIKQFFSQLDRSYPQCGIDDVTETSPDGFQQEWYKLGNKVLKLGHSAAARQFSKQGCPTGLRKKLWMCMFGMKTDNLDVLYYENLKNNVFSYDLLVDRLIMKDVRLTTTNDDSFFVFEDLLYQVLLIFSRDAWLLDRCSYLNCSPPKSYIKGKLGIPECQVCYPPSGVIPFHGFAMYAAPLCYIYEESMMLFYAFRELYIRYFSRLHLISSDTQGILSLCASFETLLQSQEPWLCKHFADIRAQPLRIIFNWLIFGFSGYLATDQSLEQWLMKETKYVHVVVQLTDAFLADYQR
eukprot:gene7285-8098_t